MVLHVFDDKAGQEQPLLLQQVPKSLPQASATVLRALLDPILEGQRELVVPFALIPSALPVQAKEPRRLMKVTISNRPVGRIPR